MRISELIRVRRLLVVRGGNICTLRRVFPEAIVSFCAEFIAYRNPSPPPGDERELCSRVHAEFLEMPGLRLTLPQASRLFSIEADRCERVLGALVHAGLLATDGKAYASPRAGRRFA